jgi:hypothetical protein
MQMVDKATDDTDRRAVRKARPVTARRVD